MDNISHFTLIIVYLEGQIVYNFSRSAAKLTHRIIKFESLIKILKAMQRSMLPRIIDKCLRILITDTTSLKGSL